MRLVWLPEARTDIQRLYNFLRERDLRLQTRYPHHATCSATLLEFPHLGRRMDDETERREVAVPFGAGAYVLRYRMMMRRLCASRLA